MRYTFNERVHVHSAWYKKISQPIDYYSIADFLMKIRHTAIRQKIQTIREKRRL